MIDDLGERHWMAAPMPPNRTVVICTERDWPAYLRRGREPVRWASVEGRPAVRVDGRSFVRVASVDDVNRLRFDDVDVFGEFWDVPGLGLILDASEAIVAAYRRQRDAETIDEIHRQMAP